MGIRKKPGSHALGKRSHCRIPKKAPVEVGDELEVNIIEVAPSGDGVTRIRGYAINVPKAKPRERVKVLITHVGEKAGNAQIIG